MIIQSLQKLMDTGEQPYAKVCTVHRVDKENKCCDVIPVDGSAELFDVPFHSSKADAGLCLYPAVDSHVLVVFINKHHACICGVSEVDLMKLKVDQTEFSASKEKVTLQTDNVTFSMNRDGFLLKKESETLKELMGDLLTQIQAMVFTVPNGTTTLLKNSAEFQTLQTRFNSFLKDV